MTTMPIDNHPLTQRRLQFIGIGVNKLTFKGIDIMQSSNYNIVSSFICWNQNIVYMEILDTSFKMTKRRSRFRGKWRVKCYIICALVLHIGCLMKHYWDERTIS